VFLVVWRFGVEDDDRWSERQLGCHATCLRADELTEVAVLGQEDPVLPHRQHGDVRVR
jgi:hypothetical protein